MNSIVKQLTDLGFSRAEQMLRQATETTDPQNGPPQGHLFTDADDERDIYYSVFASSDHGKWQITDMYVTAQVPDSSKMEGVTVLQQRYPASGGWPSKETMLADINVKIDIQRKQEEDRQERKRQKQVDFGIELYVFKRRPR